MMKALNIICDVIVIAALLCSLVCVGLYHATHGFSKWN